MANTVDITLVEGWNLIAGPGPDVNGTVSIKGAGIVKINEKNVAPGVGDETGHEFKQHFLQPFFLKTGQSLYAKTVDGNFILTVTVD